MKEKQHGKHLKTVPLCFTEESKSYRFWKKTWMDK